MIMPCSGDVEGMGTSHIKVQHIISDITRTLVQE